MVFILVICIELASLTFIVRAFIQGFLSITVVNQKAIKKMPLRQYKYFYENSANIVIKDKPDWIAKEVTYIHNKDGLNALHDYSVHKKKDVIRIATVGDSFTYGMYIDTSDNWSTLLEKKLNAQECGSSIFEVLNFGVPGYDINYTIQRNKLRVEKYSPNVVLWFIKNDDFTDAKELLIPIEKKC